MITDHSSQGVFVDSDDWREESQEEITCGSAFQEDDFTTLDEELGDAALQRLVEAVETTGNATGNAQNRRRCLAMVVPHSKLPWEDYATCWRYRVSEWEHSNMKYVQESHARDLHDELSKVFGANGPETAVSINGAGVD